MIAGDVFCTSCGATARRPGGYISHLVSCDFEYAGPVSRLVHELGCRAVRAAGHESDAAACGPDATVFLLRMRRLDHLAEGPGRWLPVPPSTGTTAPRSVP